MNNANRSCKASDLTNLINEKIAHWKAMAERNFKNAQPFSDSDEFERDWPKALDNFFLAETLRTADALRHLSEGHEN
jgi:hypothetical protein